MHHCKDYVLSRELTGQEQSFGEEGYYSFDEVLAADYYVVEVDTAVDFGIVGVLAVGPVVDCAVLAADAHAESLLAVVILDYFEGRPDWKH